MKAQAQKMICALKPWKAAYLLIRFKSPPSLACEFVNGSRFIP